MDRTATHVVYRCSYCGAIVEAKVDPFMLSKPFKLPCISCNKSALEISMTKDSKVRLSVPCLVCPHPHPYTVSAGTFFTKDLFLLSCSFSGLDICFIGTDRDKIEDEIDRTESLIMDLVADEKDDEAAQKQSDMLVADTNVVREILFAIDELKQHDGVRCGDCGSKAFKVLIDYDEVKLCCKVCGKTASLPARTKFDAANAIELEHFTI